MKKFSYLILAFSLMLTGCGQKNETFPPRPIVSGEVWNDTDGNPINAHGGGVIYHEGVYYWYGEYKGDETYRNPEVPDWECYRTEAGGVACYSSTDLSNWKFEGIVLKPEKKKGHDLNPSGVIERPKVIYNDQTKQFVMWMHIDSHDYSKAAAGVAVSKKPTGKFKYLGSMRPNDQMSRDMTLFKDDDGTGYLIYSSEENATLHICRLSDDYLQPTTNYVRKFIGESREAPAVFKRNGRYYIITSGCTAWDPNTAQYATTTNLMGSWLVMGNPCSGKDFHLTFYGQSTHVFPVVGKPDAYIAMFDKWNKTDLKRSGYIWLPVAFGSNNTINITWMRSWEMSLFDR
ncbi:glycoside hydrolase family 43 protein [Parabacteroides sp. OttesenSCG-928-N08]|nr:glycoside hydrolase family 43 protein [Parabacteroides sp. OttesenSCG-928-N08]